MKVTTVLIPTVEEQRAAGDHALVLPAGVKVPDLPMPLFLNGNYAVPKNVVGWIRRIWLEDGRLMAEADIALFDFGWGGMPDKDDGGSPPTFSSMKLVAVHLDALPAKPGG